MPDRLLLINASVANRAVFKITFKGRRDIQSASDAGEAMRFADRMSPHLIALDIGGLRGLIMRAANPILPLVLVLVPFAGLFGGAAAASAILTLPYESKYREEEEDKSEDDPSPR